MSPSQGRPRAENPKSDRLFIRVNPVEKEFIHSFSDKTGYSLLDLLYKGIETVIEEETKGEALRKAMAQFSEQQK